jgi:nucleotide-binding universal stress UspA family protein
MSLYKTILVPTDFSKYADNAIRYAEALAKASGGKVHFAHVIDQRIMDLSTVEGVYVSQADVQQSMKALEDNADKRMGQLVTKAKAFGLQAEGHVCKGRPVDELVRLGNETAADLVVIATHGRSGFDRLVLGSTCERLIRQSTIPVMSVKHPEHEVSTGEGTLRVDRILCPCDFSEFSHKAVPHAVELCKQFNATLVLMHVVDTWLDYPEFMPTVELQNSPHLAEKAKESLEEVANGISGIRTEVKVESGIPHRVLSETIDKDNIDLVVMTTHGRSGIPHFLLGSVAEKVARLAHCPVLTIRPEEK